MTTPQSSPKDEDSMIAPEELQQAGAQPRPLQFERLSIFTCAPEGLWLPTPSGPVLSEIWSNQSLGILKECL